MSLYDKLSQKDIRVLENKGYKVEEGKEYTDEYLKKILFDLEGDIINCSIKKDNKSNERDELNSKYGNIINILGKEIDI